MPLKGEQINANSSTLSTLLLSNTVLFIFEGSTLLFMECLCTISLNDFVYSYIEIEQWIWLAVPVSIRLGNRKLICHCMRDVTHYGRRNGSCLNTRWISSFMEVNYSLYIIPPWFIRWMLNLHIIEIIHSIKHRFDLKYSLFFFINQFGLRLILFDPNCE